MVLREHVGKLNIVDQVPRQTALLLDAERNNAVASRAMDAEGYGVVLFENAEKYR